MNEAVKVAAVISLAALEWHALSLGIDGVLFSLVVGLIAGIAGYQYGKNEFQKR